MKVTDKDVAYVADLANLFNPPLPSSLNLSTINTALENLLSELNAQAIAVHRSLFEK